MYVPAAARAPTKRYLSTVHPLPTTWANHGNCGGRKRWRGCGLRRARGTRGAILARGDAGWRFCSVGTRPHPDVRAQDTRRLVEFADYEEWPRACLDKCLRQAGAHTPSSLNGAP